MSIGRLRVGFCFRKAAGASDPPYGELEIHANSPQIGMSFFI